MAAPMSDGCQEAALTPRCLAPMRARRNGTDDRLRWDSRDMTTSMTFGPSTRHSHQAPAAPGRYGDPGSRAWSPEAHGGILSFIDDEIGGSGPDATNKR